MSGKIQTLHAHTVSSDGLLTHQGVLDACTNNKIGAVAFTDHDGLPNDKTVKKLKAYSGPTDWIIGIEISSGLPKDLGGGASGGPHIVGLFVDPTNKALKSHCKLAQESRIERMKLMVKNLKRLGFDITVHDCLKASGGETVGRPHIVQALKSKEKNLVVIETLRKKMETDSKNDPKIKVMYDNMMTRGEQQYPYVLFLSDDSYIKGIHVEYGYVADMDKSVSLIRNAGGLAFIAHWMSCKKYLTEEFIDKVLSENRLDGMETVYGLWNMQTGIWNETEEELKILKRLVKKHNKLESGGADAHRQEDFELFAKETWFSERTIGMAEKIIGKSGVDTTWSSFS